MSDQSEEPTEPQLSVPQALEQWRAAEREAKYQLLGQSNAEAAAKAAEIAARAAEATSEAARRALEAATAAEAAATQTAEAARQVALAAGADRVDADAASAKAVSDETAAHVAYDEAVARAERRYDGTS